MAGLRRSEIEPSLALIHALRGEGMTIVAVEHVMKAILSISDEILVLHHGRVLSLGRSHDVLSDERGDRGLPWTPVRAPGGEMRPSC